MIPTDLTEFSQSVLPLVITISVLLISVSYVVGGKKAKTCLNPKEFQNFELVRIDKINHNTATYRFALPHESNILGLPIGQHISVRMNIDGKEQIRSYTPTSSDDDLGYFDLLVKAYPTGVISKRFGELKVGDTIEVRGPKGNFIYKPNMTKEIGMIAGGTGITPMLQIIRAVLKNKDDSTKLSLIFANVNEEDILLKKELDELAAKHNQFKIYYVLNNPPKDWNGGVGFVTEDMIKTHLPKPSPQSKVLLCGPPPMIKAMSQHCEVVGFNKPRVVSKLEDQVFKF